MSDLIDNKGKVTEIKINVNLKKSNGDGTFKGHMIKLKDSDGDIQKFKMVASTEYGKKLAGILKGIKVGEEVNVKTTDEKFPKVVAVYGKNSKKPYSKGGGYKKEYDPTGAIQGMILKAAVDLTAAMHNTDATLAIHENLIVNNAEIVLLAKAKIDTLVVKALAKTKAKKEAADDDDDEVEETEDEETIEEIDEEDEESSEAEETEAEESDDEEEKPKKKKGRSPY